MTLTAEKKEVSSNKTQHLVVDFFKGQFGSYDLSDFEGFPLLRSATVGKGLSDYVQLGKRYPNIKIIVIDGWGADFMDEDEFGAFMPYMNGMRTEAYSLTPF